MRPPSRTGYRRAHLLRFALSIALVCALAAPVTVAPRNAHADASINSACSLSWDELKPHLESGLGVPYVFGGGSPSGWDCSGYASWIFNTFGGTNYTHYTVTFEQELAARGCFVMEGNGNNLRDERMQPGDIIFFYSEGVAGCTHMGIVGERVDGIVMIYHAFTNSFSDIYGHSGTMLQGLDANPGSSLRGIWYMSSGHGKGNWSKFTVYRGVVSTGSLAVSKTSANAPLTDANTNYSLAGATYGIYASAQDAANRSNPVGVMTTNEQGFAQHDNLVKGQYFIRELSPSPGYALDENVYDATVVGGQVTTCPVNEQPQSNPLSLWLAKFDRESGEAAPLGGATFAKAQFTCTFYGGQFDSIEQAEAARASGVAARTWTMQTDERGIIEFDSPDATFDIHDSAGNVVETCPYFVSGDNLYTNTSGGIVLPLGTLFIRESQAPAGYLLNEETFGPIHIVGSGTSETVSCYSNPNVAEQVKRGDLSFSKVDEQTMERMPQTAFSITSLTTGETHVVVTDENGMVNTASAWNAHSYLTNANDQLLESAPAKDAAPSASTDSASPADDTHEPAGQASVKSTREPNADATEDNSSQRSASESDDNRNREVEKGSSDNIAGDKNASNGTDSADAEANNRNNKATIDAGGANDIPSSSQEHNAETPALKQTENAANADKRNVPNDDVQTPHKPDAAHQNESTEANSDSQREANENNSDQTALDTYKEEAAADPLAGVWFSGRANETTPVDDSLGALPYDTYRITELPSASNEGKNLVEFTVTISRDQVNLDLGTVDNKAASAIHTTLTGEQGAHLAVASGPITLNDTIEYDNLIPGKTYTLTGVLHRVALDDDGNKTDAGELMDAGGNPVSTQIAFTPDMTHGTTSVQFTLDASELAGSSVVAFESVSLDDKEVAVHADITDEDQTVYFPAIKTSLSAAEGHEVTSTELCQLVDTVSYAHLCPGKTYELVATLHIKSEDGSDGGIACDSSANPITTRQSFVAQTSTGTVDVPFAFDASLLGGSTVVAFEELTFNGVAYAAHADISDEAQSAMLPHLATSATDAADGDSEIDCIDDAAIVDRVSYRNLNPQKTYRLVATVHVAAQNSDGSFSDAGPLTNADGSIVQTEKEFTPEAGEGSTELQIPLSAKTLAGKKLVVFEECYCGQELVAKHADINDDAQSVKVFAPKAPEKDQGKQSGSTFAKTGNPLYEYRWAFILLAAIGTLAGVIGARAAISARKKKSNE